MFFNLLRIFVEWRQIKIVEPKPLKKDIIKKNESIDNFIKIQIPWIL